MSEEPFALSMSSGFFGFYAHCGLLTALEEERLLPVRCSGSSAGALVAGVWASGVDCARIRGELLALERDHFWDPGLGAGLLRGARFRRQLERLLASESFEGCRVPLSVSVYDLLALRTGAIDSGPLAPAIHASCAVPLLFHPVWIDGRPLLDGGIADRPGFAGMPPMRLLYHHLPTRSPWRLPWSRARRLPRREGMATLVLEGVPRVDPFHLERGAAIFEQVYRASRQALDRPLREGAVVRLGVT